MKSQKLELTEEQEVYLEEQDLQSRTDLKSQEDLYIQSIGDLRTQDYVKREFHGYNLSKYALVVRYCQLGITLLQLKHELKNRFYKVITEDVMPKKEVTRAMKFVLTIEANKNFREAMQVTKDVFAIERKMDMFVTDERITALSTSNMSTMVKPSVSKVLKMKELNDEDFYKVLGGDDTPLLLLNKKGEEKVDRYKYKPSGMPNDEYDSIVKAGINPIINEYWNLKQENERLKALLK